MPNQSFAKELIVGNTFKYEIIPTNQDPLNLAGTGIERFTIGNIEFLKVEGGYAEFFQGGMSQEVKLTHPSIDNLYFAASMSFKNGAILLAESGVMVSQYSSFSSLLIIANINFLNGTRLSNSYNQEGGSTVLFRVDGSRDMEYCKLDNYSPNFSQINEFECSVKFTSEDYEYTYSYILQTDQIKDGIVSQYFSDPTFHIMKINPDYSPDPRADNVIVNYLNFSRTDLNYDVLFDDNRLSGEIESNSLDVGWVADYNLGNNSLPNKISMQILKDPDLGDQGYDMKLLGIDYTVSSTVETTDEEIQESEEASLIFEKWNIVQISLMTGIFYLGKIKD